MLPLHPVPGADSSAQSCNWFDWILYLQLPVVPRDNEGLVNSITAQTELECKQACQDDKDCEIYSFLALTNDCKLLKDVPSFDGLGESDYVTGPGNCLSEDGICTFSLLGNSRHVMLVDMVALLVWSGMLDCKMNVSLVVVGQGGKALGCVVFSKS